MNSIGGQEKSGGRESLRRRLSPEQLEQKLRSHATWLDQGVPAGARGDLSDCHLSSADFSNQDLRLAIMQRAILSQVKLRRLRGAQLEEADLVNADLRAADAEEADFGGADLRYADLREANLRGANFQKARLSGAKLRDADLQDANLVDAIGVFAGQLGGANVTGAKLPEAIKAFEGLRTVEQASDYARTLFVSMLAGCLYCVLTIATTTDARLLTNSSSSPLPIIQTPIPIVGFYLTAPLILVCLYIYFHLAIQRLWEQLADLPAVFPDGRGLDRKAFPWLLTGIVSTHFRLLRRSRPQFSRLQNAVAVLLSYWVVPITLLLLWARYLARHEWFGSLLNVAALASTILFAYIFQRLAKRTLRGEAREETRRANRFRRLRLCSVWLLLTGMLWILSVGVFTGTPQGGYRNYYRNAHLGFPQRPRGVMQWSPVAFSLVGYNPFADLTEAEVSQKPPSWAGKEDEIPLAKGAYLRDADLRYCNAERSFLVNADLRYSDLRGADLRGADLRGAKLDRAILVEANLQGADLRGASGFTVGQVRMAFNWILALYSDDILRSMALPPDHNDRLKKRMFEDADFHGLQLAEADLARSNLSRANLSGANLTWANLEHSNLEGANFAGANLSGAHTTCANLRSVNFAGANLTEVNFEVWSKESDLFGGKSERCSDDIRGADFRGATGIDAGRLKTARNWQFALYSDDMLKQLDLPPEHNLRLEKQSAEDFRQEGVRNPKK